MTTHDQASLLRQRLISRGKRLLMNPFAKSASVTVRRSNGQAVTEKRGIKKIPVWTASSPIVYFYTDRGELVYRYQPSVGEVIMEVIPLHTLEDEEIEILLSHL